MLTGYTLLLRAPSAATGRRPAPARGRCRNPRARSRPRRATYKDLCYHCCARSPIRKGTGASLPAPGCRLLLGLGLCSMYCAMCPHSQTLSHCVALYGSIAILKVKSGAELCVSLSKPLAALSPYAVCP
eukprot:COSAG06_NODE_8898_length_2037_cov_9.738296_3_plen_128_part_01